MGAVVFVETIRLLIVLLLTAAGHEVAIMGAEGEVAPFVGATLGAGSGYVIGGTLGRRVSRSVDRMEHMKLPWSPPELLSGGVFAAIGGLLGLVAGAGAVVGLGWRFGGPIAAVTSWLAMAMGGRIGLRASAEFWSLIGLSPIGLSSSRRLGESTVGDALLLDSSAVLDGRMLEIVRSGFIRGTLLVPRFVLDEIQAIADAQDPARRRRGRRALELLDVLDNETSVSLRVIDDEVPEVTHVDAKLVTLGRRLDVRLITNDQPLARVAELQGVPCLFLSRLAAGLRDETVPGEVISVELIREGSESGQGVGFREDGSMVVVTDAAVLLGSRVDVRVSHSVPTAKGTMHFGTLALHESSLEPTRST
ncbi:MAG: hypothetical protein GY708_25445 [Actinomycetia bacterium]|nr:hypothetical protein [Actinomycetes bacterium]